MTSSHRLTQRERVVLAHLALPLTLSEIAASLFVSRNTVKSQVRSIYMKLDVADRESALSVGRVWELVPADLGQPEVTRTTARMVDVPRPLAYTSRR